MPDVLVLQIAAHDGVGFKHVFPVFKKGDHIDLFGLEITDPLGNGDISLIERFCLLADHEILVVMIDAIQALRRHGHGQDHLVDGRGVTAVKETGGIAGTGDALQGFQEHLGLVPLHVRIGHPQGQADIFSQAGMFKEVFIFGQQFSDHEGIDLFTFAVPHLLITADMGKGIVGLLNFIFSRHVLVFRKKRELDIVGVLG